MPQSTLKVGVILSGCGVFDGSEIHEAVLTLLALDQRGAMVQCFAPNKNFDAVDHLTRKPAGSQRNILSEAARIARGQIADLATAQGNQLDAWVLPGGFGAAKNLCTFASDGPNCQVDPQVARVLNQAQQAGKPIAFLCIAPTVAAKVFGQSLHPTLTIGHDEGTAAQIERMGARHQACDAGNYVVDGAHRIVSTPAYMEAKSISQLHQGIDATIAKLLDLAKR